MDSNPLLNLENGYQMMHLFDFLLNEKALEEAWSKNAKLYKLGNIAFYSIVHDRIQLGMRFFVAKNGGKESEMSTKE